MKDKQEALAHCQRILLSFNALAGTKYAKGFVEHGGDLQDKTPLELLYEIRDEAIDTFIYAQTAIDKLKDQ